MESTLEILKSYHDKILSDLDVSTQKQNVGVEQLAMCLEFVRAEVAIRKLINNK